MKFDKSKVYTVLNADELKKGDKVIVADDLVFLKALVERGSKLSTIDEIYDENCQSRFLVEGYDYVYSLAYLVERKGEKHFRPYKDTDEMIIDFCNRFVKRTLDASEFPMIWVKNKDSGYKYLISAFAEKTITYLYHISNLVDVFENFTYLDNSPCGVEE